MKSQFTDTSTYLKKVNSPTSQLVDGQVADSEVNLSNIDFITINSIFCTLMSILPCTLRVHLIFSLYCFLTFPLERRNLIQDTMMYVMRSFHHSYSLFFNIICIYIYTAFCTFR